MSTKEEAAAWSAAAGSTELNNDIDGVVDNPGAAPSKANGSSGGNGLEADRSEIARFVHAILKNADLSHGIVHVRAFAINAKGEKKPFRYEDWSFTSLGGPGTIERIVDRAVTLATICANSGTAKAVFSPPVAVFAEVKKSATEADVSQGLAIAVEIDDDVTVAIAALEAILGPATITVQSGGVTADGEPKIHAYWRLTVTARSEDERIRLRRARRIAAKLVGADPTGAPLSHPMRWPGSWHLKATPRLARIVAETETENEVDLDDALAKLTAAAEAAGLDPDGIDTQVDPATIDWDAAKKLIPVAVGALPVKDEIKALIVSNERHEHRSRVGFKVLYALAFGGASNETMAAVMLDPVLPIGAYVRGKGRRVRIYLADEIASAVTFARNRTREAEATKLGVNVVYLDEIREIAKLPLIEREQRRGDLAKRLKVRVGVVDQILGNVAYSQTRNDHSSPNPMLITSDDFYAYLPDHKYIYVPTRQLWPAESVDAVLMGCGGSAAELDQGRAVAAITWAPGLPMIIKNRLAVLDGGWVNHPGANCFNLYRAPPEIEGDAQKAAMWVDHARFIYPADAERIIDWLAHRVSHPGEKVNHALVLAGNQGIGKDTLLEPAAARGRAVGPWNFQEVTPRQVNQRFNGYLRSVILRINEAHDLGDFTRFQFYDHLKAYIAAPPDVLRVDEKNLREYAIANLTGVIITTNHRFDGLFLPSDDRRHYVAWSDKMKEDPEFQGGYWTKIWDWYEKEGGFGHVGAFLRERDLSGFDAKAPPPKTEAFWMIVNAGRGSEEAELEDAIELLNNPDAFVLADLRPGLTEKEAEWLYDRKNARTVPIRLERVGYVPVLNPDATDHRWRIEGRKTVVYAKGTLTTNEAITAVRKLQAIQNPIVKM